MNLHNPADTLGNAGDLPTITFRDMEYKVAWPTPKSLTMIANEIARIAVQQATEAATYLPGKEAAELKSQVFSLISAREHHIGGQLWDAANSSNYQANIYLLWSLVKANHPSFTTEDATNMQLECMTDVEAVLLMVAPRFLELTLAKQPLTEPQKEQVRAKLQEEVEARKNRST
jgi:hypothetical protein